MAEAYYEPTPATDGATMNPVPGAVFQVFEIADTAFATPLSLRVGSGNPTTTVTASDTLATLPGVYVTSPNFEHIWKSGTFEWRRDSIDGAKKAIEDAKIAASNSASASDASAVSAATSAQAAQDAASLVDAPADTVMRDVAANPASAFGSYQNANFVSVSESAIDPRRYGAKGDYNPTTGTGTNDTAALREAFDALPTTGGTIILRGGRFLTHRIYVTGKSNIKVIFDNAEMVANPGAPDTGAGDAGVLLVFANCADLTLLNLSLNGNRANIASIASGSTNRGVQVALKISDCTRVQVNSPRIVEAVQDGIAGSNNKQLTITSPIMENIGESGVYFSTGSEDIAINGGTFKNTGASGDWGNVIQFRKDCQRINISGVTSEQSYGGIAMTEGITDVSISGFVGHNMGIPFSINTAGTINLTNARIRVTGSVFEASASPRVAFNTTVQNFSLVACDFIGAFPHVSGFDTMVGCTLDGLTPGVGNPAAILKAKARVLGSIIRNITGRGVEVQGAGSAVYDTQFDTLSDLAIRILAAGTGFRHSGNKYTAVTGGPLFDSTTDSLGGVSARPSAAASTLGTLTKKVELFDANGVSVGFVPIYGSIT